MGQISICGWKCEICSHEWASRTDSKPVRCAKCKSPYWDQDRVQDTEKVVVEVSAPKKIAESVAEAVAQNGVGGTPFLPRPGKSEETDMDTLRAICAGKIPDGMKSISEVHMPPESLSQSAPQCTACEEPLEAVKGKWVCGDNTCGLFGRAQGSVE